MNEKIQNFFERLDSYYTAGDLRNIEMFLLESKKEFESCSDPASAVIVYNEIGSFYRSISQYTKSLEAFSLARDVVEELSGKGAQYATVLNNMAGTYRLMQDYESALKLFSEAAEIYLANDMDQSFEYTSLLNNMALLYRHIDKKQEALDCLYQALERIEKMEDCRQEVAITYNNLMSLHFALGQREEAMYCANRSLQEYSKCNEDEKIHYAATLNSMAALLFSEECYDQALDMYKKSLKQTMHYFGENEDYANTCMNMYWVYHAMKDKKNAGIMVEKACAVYKKILGADHEKTRMAGDICERFLTQTGTMKF